MSRREIDRLRDILLAIDTIDTYLAAGSSDEGLVYDAVRMRSVEIGEASAALPDETRAAAPEILWSQAVGMRNELAHRYSDQEHGIVSGTVHHDLPVMRAAVERLLARFPR